MEKVFSSSLSTSSRTFLEFVGGNNILFEIKVFGEKINGTTLAMLSIEITARSHFKQLRIIRQINRFHYRLK